MIQSNSETLIQQLALRDELEFEKELKNKNKYFYKMFEAIGVATLYSRKIGKWTG